MHVLIVYYSFTGQAKRAADATDAVVRAAGHDVTALRLEVADPDARLTRPLAWAQITAWGRKASAGETVPVLLDPPSAARGDYDLVLLFTNTWSFSPSVPIQSFLKSQDGRRLLGGKPVAIYVICRGFWRSNLAKTTALVEAAGGRVIGGEAFVHPGAWLTSTIQTVRHMMSTTDQRRWGVLPLPAFGLSEASMSRLEPFTLRALDAAAGGSAQADPSGFDRVRTKN